MIKKNLKTILSLVIWLGLLILAIVTMPNTSQVIKEKGQVTLPQNVQSNIARQMSDEFASDKSGGREIIAVFNSSNKLTKTQNDEIKSVLDTIKSQKSRYGITEIVQASDSNEVKKQVVSKDNTTQMAMITLKSDDDLLSKSETIKSKLRVQGVSTYITGSELLSAEFSETTEKGIEKTELIAAIFIFVVLILVFRSPIVPLISLSTVGISLIISLNVIVNLAKYFNFPISDFTQVFLVVVLFGIGTDYNILLYDQFKEELHKGTGAKEAAILSRKMAGRTILYSGISVLIGFSVLALAKFSFYQSAVGVAIGVGILIVNLLTFNLFFMKVLGPKMFWPSKISNMNNQSKFWHKLSNIAIIRPIVTLILIGILAIPFVLFYQNQTLNFNDADEIQNTNPIKKGYVTIQKHFSKGTVSPTTIYIESDKSLVTKENLAVIDSLTEYIKKEDGIKQVSSVTQPLGEKVKELYLNNQLSSINSGLLDSSKGLDQISKGLEGANSELSNANLSSQVSNVQKLADGAQTLANSTQQLASGTKQYTQGVGEVTSGIGDLNTGQTELTSSFEQVVTGSNELTQQVQSLKEQIDSLTNLKSTLGDLAQQVPGMQEQVDLTQLDQLKTYYDQLNTGIVQLNSALKQINNELPTLSSGSNQLLNGGQELNKSGKELTNSTDQISDGTEQVNSGVQEINSQMSSLSTQVNQLSGGLSSSTAGLTKIKSGLIEVNNYLTELQKSYVGNTLYIPNSVLQGKDLKESYDTYISKNKKMTQISVILNEDPSTLSAAKKITNISKDVKARIKGTSLSNAKIAFGGQTSETADLEEIASKDFVRTAVIMIIGISIALIFITNSIIQPLSILFTLLIAFVGSLGVTRILSNLLLGKELLTWNTPFFTFIMLVALGVDYSIFLMMRYKDNKEKKNMEDIPSIKNAMLVIGVVVLSAALILGGTFAALIPSGVTTLIQVAIGVIVGLLILITLLPLIVSAVIKLSDK